ncbi:MAG: hypothetical protein ACRDIL_06835 [Candidatus Limnocylindrales bacterium]
MVGSGWFRRAGPGIAVVGALALIASTTLGAPARVWRPDDCAGRPRLVDQPRGTWFRLDPTLTDGERTGGRLAVGSSPGDSPRLVELDAESFAAGPFDGAVLLGTDDGRQSRLALLDVAAGCVWPIGSSPDVIRRATLSPDRGAIYEYRVDRVSRAGLGVWRRPMTAGAGAARVVAPIEADERFGPTWLTSLSWSDDGSVLAIQSCGEVACRVRLWDPLSGDVHTVADPRLGDLVGVTADHLVAHGACRGLPCPLLSVRLADGHVETLEPEAGAATMSRDAAGRPVAVYERDPDGRTLRKVGLDGSGARDIDGPTDARRLVAGVDRTDSAIDAPPGWLVFGPDGRLPIDGPVGPLLRPIGDGSAVPLDEVP